MNASAPLTALVNVRVLGDHGPREGCAVLVEAERIHAIAPADDPRVAHAECIDLEGKLLAPGFIDVQVNGGGGRLFNDDPGVETLRVIAAAHRRFGTTGLLPTLISDDAERTRAALEAVDAAIAQGVPGILGIHLEGPFLAPARKGIHAAARLRALTADDLDLLCQPRRGVLMLTLAPECVSVDAIRVLSQAGVRVVIGHSGADYATVRQALDAGACGFTHLYNAMSPLGSREPGVVGAALDDPHTWCGLIVDGQHAHPASLRVALAAKPRGKCVLVTDAMPPVGTDAASFELDGQTIGVRDGAYRNADGVLAGSALDMARALRNAMAWLDLPLAEAARMASAYPAAWLGLERTHGRLVAGQRADFAVLDDDLHVIETWIGGARHRHGPRTTDGER